MKTRSEIQVSWCQSLLMTPFPARGIWIIGRSNNNTNNSQPVLLCERHCLCLCCSNGLNNINSSNPPINYNSPHSTDERVRETHA